MKMSEERREYDTGAVRSADCEQTRYDLISPIGLKALAKTYAEGANKFGFCNWENGMPVTDLLNHAIAHIYNFLGGDRTEEHLAHATWNLLGAIHSMEMWPELNQKWLRGENCECPVAAKIDAQVADEIDVDIATAQVGPSTYAVGSQADIEQLRQTIFGKSE